jgi:peptidoglycan/LPS O-acetylase OafA/YrhL
MGVVAGLLVLRQGRPDHDTSVKVMGVSTVPGNRWARQTDWCAGIFTFLVIALSVVQVAVREELGGAWWMQGLFPFVLLQIIVGLSMTGPNGASVTSRLLNWPPLLFLGRISMSLYLVHETVIQYVAWAARPEQTWAGALPTPMPAWGTAVVIPVSLVLAVVLERFVEAPARQYLSSKSRAQTPGQVPGSFGQDRTRKAA